MRKLRKKEKAIRGCIYCKNLTESQIIKGKFVPAGCPYAECPYHELDNVKSYDEYLKNANIDDPVNKFLSGLEKERGRKK